MNVEIPRTVRSGLYIGLMLGSPIVAYLQSSGYIGADEVTFWLALSAVIAAIARINLTPPAATNDDGD